MSDISMSLHQIELLIDGYCKNNGSNENFPMMLTKQTALFYNEINHWTFKGEEYKQFMSTPSGEEIRSKPFKIKNIIFELFLFPNGDSTNNQTLFGFSISKLPQNIEYILVKLTFYNKECNYLNTVTAYAKQRYCRSSSVVVANISKFKHKNEINFHAKLELLRIHPKDFKNNMCLLYHKSNISMNKNLNCKWNITGNVLSKIKSEINDLSVSKYYRSNYFDNNNWILKLYRKIGVKDQYRIRLCLCQIPKDVKQIYFTLLTKIYRNGEIILDTQRIKKRNHEIIYQSTGTPLELNEELLLKTTSILVSVNIEITEVMNFDDINVEKDDWNKYDIV